MTAFGQRTRRLLPYSQAFISITSGAGTAGGYVFSANGLFDPNITGTGGQPMFFDEMMRLYNHYTCLKSNIRVNFANTTSAAECTVGLAVTGASTLVTSIEQIMETGRVSTMALNPLNINGSQCNLRAGVNCARFQGIQTRGLAIMSDPDMRGDAASNPTEQIYFILYVWRPFDSTVCTVAAQVILEYDTIFHEPRTGLLSLASQNLEENKHPQPSVGPLSAEEKEKEKKDDRVDILSLHINQPMEAVPLEVTRSCLAQARVPTRTLVHPRFCNIAAPNEDDYTSEDYLTYSRHVESVFYSPPLCHACSPPSVECTCGNDKSVSPQ
jgi:hypothetical protein